jgi:hypothetical protein
VTQQAATNFPNQCRCRANAGYIVQAYAPDFTVGGYITPGGQNLPYVPSLTGPPVNISGYAVGVPNSGCVCNSALYPIVPRRGNGGARLPAIANDGVCMCDGRRGYDNVVSTRRWPLSREPA